MLYEDVKMICKVMCSLVKQNVDLGFGKMLGFDYDDGICF